MKSRNKVLVFIIALSTFQLTMAQEGFLMDSVKIDLGNHKSIELITENFHNIHQKGKLDSIYDLFIQDLNKVEAALISANNSNTMQYDYRSNYRRIQMNSEKVVSTEVFVDRNGNLIYFQKVGFALGEKDELTVKASSVEGLKEIALLDLDAIIEKADAKVSPKGKHTNKHKSAQLSYTNNQFSDSLSRIASSAKDMIELGLGFGLGTVRSDLTPDFEIKMMAGLSKKGLIRHQFGFSNQWLYSFNSKPEGGYRIQRDGFLDVVYSISSKSTSNKRMVTKGIKFGRLIDSGSNNFRSDTYRIGLFKSLGSGISLEGGFFAEDNFSEAFPYARLAWSW